MHALTHSDTSRYDRGLAKLSEIDGEAGHKVISALADVAPDFARLLIEFPFGDVYSRPGLDLRAREIATIAALTAMGNAAPQLRVHVEAGLNVGVSPTEIVETVMQMAVYAGFPAALNGLFVVKEVFSARGIAPVAPTA
jgi:4-carboxymuconolactone decarboxylase